MPSSRAGHDPKTPRALGGEQRYDGLFSSKKKDHPMSNDAIVKLCEDSTFLAHIRKEMRDVVRDILPPGWFEKKDATGKTYYIHNDNPNHAVYTKPKWSDESSIKEQFAHIEKDANAILLQNMRMRFQISDLITELERIKHTNAQENTRTKKNTSDNTTNDKWPDKLFKRTTVMSPERFKQIVAMNVIISPQSDVGKELVDTAIKQINSWHAGYIDWLKDFSHPQAYTAMGLTPQQGTACNQSGYVYNRDILKQILNKRRLQLHTDRTGGDQPDNTKREWEIVTWANRQFVGSTEFTAAQSAAARKKYEQDVSRGIFHAKATGMYNQAFSVSSLFV